MSEPMSPKRILLLGASGTAGQGTARALVAQGYEVTALVRRPCGELPSEIVQRVGNVQDPRDVDRVGFANGAVDAIVSCLASRSGLPKDAWAIDYEAHSKVLEMAQARGVRQFVYLSAICVQKPTLAFQQAKLAFEAELAVSGLTYSIVRPTAFFKSLSGQVDRMRAGKPYLMFADGAATACKPISDTDLGQFIASCLSDPARQNAILPIGGPGPALTPAEQGALLADALGIPFRARKVPVSLLGAIVGLSSALGRVSETWAARAQLARIGQYYATQSMLVWNPQTERYDPEATPEFGTERLADHYAALARGDVEVDLGEHAVF